jgi:uncharacterized iron-regulated protein
MRSMSSAAALGAAALAVLLAACGGSAGRPGAAAPARGIEAAALPYRIVDGKTGRQVDEAAFWTALEGARAICVGEDHPNPHHHWAQLRIVDGLSSARPGLGLGLEMVQRPFQGVLDDWTAHRIDDAALLSGTGWADRWGYDFAMYRPMLARTAERGGAVLALNASRELTKKVSKKGLAALSEQELVTLPAMVLDDARHRAWFDGVMEAMGGAAGHSDKSDKGDDAKAAKADKEAAARAERIYSVQVLWDETMADGAHRWLAADPERRIVILAGNGHCHDSAIVGRLRRRGIAATVSVRPLIDTAEGDLAAAVAEGIHDYLFVMSR